MFGNNIGSIFFEIGADTSKAESGFSRVTSAIQAVAGRAGTLATAAATGFGMAVAGPILNTIGGAFDAIQSGVVDTNAALEQSNVTWQVLKGSAEAAQQHIQQLFDFGATTPFEFKEVDAASRLLQTFGGDALNTRENLTLVGDGAAAAGRGFQEVAFWTGRLYDAMMGGQPLGEPLMNLQQMGLISGETRAKLEALQKEGAKGPELWAAYAESQQKFSGMMEKQSATFSGRLSTLGDTINMLMATAGKPIFEKLSAGLGNLVNLLSSPAIMAGAEAIATTLAGGIERVLSMAAQAIPTVLSFASSIKNIVDLLATGDFKGGIFNFEEDSGFITFLLTVRDTLLGLWPTMQAVGQTLASIWTSASSAIAPFLPQLAAFAAAFMGASSVIGAFSAIGAAIPAILAAIGGAIAALLSPVTLVAGAIGLLAVAWMQNWGNIQGITAGVIAGLMGLFNTIATAISPVIAIIGTALVGAFNVLQGAGAALFSAFQASLPAMAALWTQLQTVGLQVWQAFQQLTPVFGLVAGVIGGALVTAVGVLMGALTGIVGFLRGALSGALQAASGLITMFSGAFQVASSVIVGVVRIIGNVLQGDWAGALQAAKDLFVGVINGIKTFFSGFADYLTGLVRGLVGGVLGMVQGFVDGFIGWFKSLYDGVNVHLNGLASDLVNKVRGAIDGVINAISGAVGSAINAARSVGDGIIDGIVSGINAGIRWVTDAISNLAQSAVDTAKSILGISSPSTVFARMGRDTSAGYVEGIAATSRSVWTSVRDAMVGAVGAAERTLAAATPATLPVMATATPVDAPLTRDAAPRGTSPITITLNVSGSVITQQELEAALVNAVRNAQTYGYL